MEPACSSLKLRCCGVDAHTHVSPAGILVRPQFNEGQPTEPGDSYRCVPCHSALGVAPTHAPCASGNQAGLPVGTREPCQQACGRKEAGGGGSDPRVMSAQFLAMVFQDLLTNKDDYLRASRALLREIIKQTKHEVNFQAFCLGLMQERKEAPYLEMEFKVPPPSPGWLPCSAALWAVCGWHPACPAPGPRGQHGPWSAGGPRRAWPHMGHLLARYRGGSR